jgi:hypothetical protein
MISSCNVLDKPPLGHLTWYSEKITKSSIACYSMTWNTQNHAHDFQKYEIPVLRKDAVNYLKAKNLYFSKAFI